jgi:alkylhydroperoxidase family enzyme
MTTHTPTQFPIHTQASAPPDSQAPLAQAVADWGIVPNLMGVLATAPSAISAYNALHGLFMATSLSNEEKTVVWQSINIEHQCHYCVPAHTAMANMMKIDQAVISALNLKTRLPNEKLEALRSTTLQLVRNRGILTAQEVTSFLAAGYSQKNLLEIIVGIAQKTISNYTNHLAQTPLDDFAKPFATMAQG